MISRRQRFAFPLILTCILLCILICLAPACTRHISRSVQQQSPVPRSSSLPPHSLNLSFEQLDSTGKPKDWMVYDDKGAYSITRDSTTTHDGRYAMLMQRLDSTPNHTGVLRKTLPIPAMGDTVVVSVWIRTENVTGPAPLLWLRADGPQRNMFGLVNEPRAIDLHGTHDWTKVTATLALDPAELNAIYAGIFFRGSGRVWVGHMEASIDGHPLEQLPLKDTTAPDNIYTLEASASAALQAHMNVNPSLAPLSDHMIRRLADLGMLWGFLKYHHPAIGIGRYDWDAELFRILPAILNAPNDKIVDSLESAWVAQLGDIPACASCQHPDKDSANIRLTPDYADLFNAGHLSPTLQEKLAFIRDNHTAVPNHYYLGFSPSVWNPVFRHEHHYAAIPNPTPALRLLTLYRYWNMIQYFSPYRYRANDWNKAMARYIPDFLLSSGSQAYVATCLRLIGDVRDTHANIYSREETQDSLIGLHRLPFTARFAEGQAVVTGHLIDDPQLRRTLPIGTIIHGIDGLSIDSLIKLYQPLTPASNYPTQLRNMTSLSGFLWRSDSSASNLIVEYHDSVRYVHLDRLGLDPRKIHIPPPPPPGNKAFQLLGDDIGYIKPGYLKEHSIDTIRTLFTHTKGLIIDLRCYPSAFMPFTYGAWLKEKSSPFACFSFGSLEKPGQFTFGNPIANGGGKDTYKGKVIIIVDATTQSQAEYTTMALQTIPGALVIGSTTAGADGNVSGIFLPGNIFTYISGIGVYYPDRTETQGDGIRIDIPLKVTVKGIREGRDEFLEEAIRLITAGASTSSSLPAPLSRSQKMTVPIPR